MFLFLIGLQLLLAAIFHYRKIFFLVVMLSFLWAGTNVPFRSLWGTVRWAVLLCGAIVGLVLWLREEREHFGAQHLIALFCGVAALTSAIVSAFPRTAFLKAMSLVLLFAYTSSGTRLAILNQEWQFSRTLVRISEGITYLTAGCYLALGLALFGNPNSLGAVVGVVLVPTLLWDCSCSAARGQGCSVAWWQRHFCSLA
jgi:hypothetical protein